MKSIFLYIFCLSSSLFISNGSIPIDGSDIAKAAESIANPHVVYDPSYFKITYPNGDVPAQKGVCTDVLIRTFRKLGIDLQKEVHEDMLVHFKSYPQIWGASKPDRNIDHRRVPNLMYFFKRKGLSLHPTLDSKDYVPGDIVAWSLGGGMTHIGIIVTKSSVKWNNTFQMMHNIGGGQVIEDVLFSYKIIGHYRWK